MMNHIARQLRKIRHLQHRIHPYSLRCIHCHMPLHWLLKKPIVEGSVCSELKRRA